MIYFVVVDASTTNVLTLMCMEAAGVRELRQNASQDANDRVPDWFNNFLLDRQTRKPSAHTMKALTSQ